MPSLTLTCQQDNRVMIGENIILCVDSINAKQVTLTFRAPIEVSIDTEENRARKLRIGLDANVPLTNREPVKEVELGINDIAAHIEGIAEIYSKDKCEAQAIRLLRLIDEFRLLSDYVLLGILAACSEESQ